MLENSQTITLMLTSGNMVLLLGIIWRTAAWKTEVDAQIKQHAERLFHLAQMSIHPEADRRLAVVERDCIHRDQEMARLKDDLVKRLERIEAKLDRQQREMETR
jgi:hypothetical protein